VTAATGDSEALGMVFAEAQASGTPVVSSNHGGISEVVIDGETGLLAPERDTEALAIRLSRLLGDDELWQRYSDRAADWAERCFDLEVQTRKLERIYADVTSRPSIRNAPATLANGHSNGSTPFSAVHSAS
jgi:glycosyltransferase involved in cell wall biosynthesis